MLGLKRSEITWTAPRLQRQFGSVFRRHRPARGLPPTERAEAFYGDLDALTPGWEAEYGRRGALRIRRIQIIRAVVGYHAHKAFRFAARVKRIFSSAN